MPVNLQQATKIVQDTIPNGNIQRSILYNGLFIFQVFTDDPNEGQYDPFYSVNQETGEIKEFCIFTDGDFGEVSRLFMNTKGG